MNFLSDLWNQITGSGLVEPGMLVWATFIFIFIVLPIVTVVVTFKLLAWCLTAFRDWWNDKN